MSHSGKHVPEEYTEWLQESIKQGGQEWLEYEVSHSCKYTVYDRLEYVLGDVAKEFNEKPNKNA